MITSQDSFKRSKAAYLDGKRDGRRYRHSDTEQQERLSVALRALQDTNTYVFSSTAPATRQSVIISAQSSSSNLDVGLRNIYQCPQGKDSKFTK
ncbi:hypothetical protein J6590_005178 [Homalodisca vitripennis]|nr:hypothetical protein J6590_005178 [Homalodisca vitripennis]